MNTIGIICIITQDGAVAVAAYLFDTYVQLYDISLIDKSVEELTLSSIVGTENAVLGALFAPGRVNLTCCLRNVLLDV